MKNSAQLNGDKPKVQSAYRDDSKRVAVPVSAAKRPQAGVAGAPGLERFRLTFGFRSYKLRIQGETTMANTKNNTVIFNRFRANSVAGRILTVLAAGKPLTVAQVARAAKPRSTDNLMAPGGWYALLRAYGKTTRKFNLSKTDDGKLVMIVRKGVKVAA